MDQLMRAKPSPAMAIALVALFVAITGVGYAGAQTSTRAVGDPWLLGGNAGTMPGTEFLGTTDNRPLHLAVNGARALRIAPASDGSNQSPNLIGGAGANTVSNGVHAATIAGGGRSDPASQATSNRVTDDWGTVGGGGGNRAGDGSSSLISPFATVAGGEDNSAADDHVTIGGGESNLAFGDSATIGGGLGNTARAGFSTVGGGQANTAGNSSGDLNATIAGGTNNTVTSGSATVGGGFSNTAAAGDATIAGGSNNEVTGLGATVAGGSGNTAEGERATVAGFFNWAQPSATYATVPGGDHNVATDPLATIGGGRFNDAEGYASTVPGGELNAALGDYSFAAGRRARAPLGSFVWADANDFNFSSGVINSFRVRATGGAQFVSAINNTGGATAGVALPAGGGSWSSLSDRESKTAITPVAGGEVLDRLDSLPISTWSYRAQGTDVRHIGPMAQDFRRAFGVGEDRRHIGSLDADGVALAAIKGLNERHESLRGELASLRGGTPGPAATVPWLGLAAAAILAAMLGALGGAVALHYRGRPATL